MRLSDGWIQATDVVSQRRPSLALAIGHVGNARAFPGGAWSAYGVPRTATEQLEIIGFALPQHWSAAYESTSQRACEIV